MGHLHHINSKLKKVLSTTSHSFVDYVALLTFQVVLSIWVFVSSGDIGSAQSKYVSAHYLYLPQPIFNPMDPAAALSFAGIVTLGYGIVLWLSLMRIGYDLERKRIPLDEILLVGAACGLLLGAVSLVVPSALVLSVEGAASMALIAPLIIVGLFSGLAFGLTLVTIGALVKKYVLS